MYLSHGERSCLAEAKKKRRTKKWASFEGQRSINFVSCCMFERSSTSSEKCRERLIVRIARFDKLYGTVRGDIVPGVHRFRLRFVGVVNVEL